jgi:hypothetical protein
MPNRSDPDRDRNPGLWMSEQFDLGPVDNQI